MKITPLKEAIKTRLQERYPGTDPDDFFTKWDAQPFGNDNDTECHITNPRSQGCPRFQSGEELANSVGKINA